jgi:hypothetical protein
MSSFVRSKPNVKIRKNRQCTLCLEIYYKGTIMRMDSGYWDGGWFRSYWCKCCQHFHEVSPDVDFSDGYMPGEFLEYEGFKEFKEEYKKEHNEF